MAITDSFQPLLIKAAFVGVIAFFTYKFYQQYQAQKQPKKKEEKKPNIGLETYGDDKK